jgi:biotin carboxyl carrier protein
MVIEYKKNNGDEVKEGDIVVVLEAMKMMNNFQATKDGILSGIKFDSGDSVAKNDVLFVVD